jgi:hypothetical protein
MVLSDSTLADIDEAAPIIGSLLTYAGMPAPLAQLLARAIPRLVRIVATDDGSQLHAMLDAAEDAAIAAERQKFGQ